MKRYIIEQLANETDTITIMFTNGKQHTFCQVANECPDNPNIIELKLSDAQYIVLVNIDQVTYISHHS
ncbi:TPA: hypothetical protein SVI46_001609 [Streptococcus equi subsp. equi]|uniref:hypothetical protein n=1 Tax=Streptococcus equi TaxID=1336 RepID=UPI001E2EC8B8|nr:hypothetical protein [Streptococcus equi]HEL0710536.1 hypothetical protein [Streptococcus equi subsp. zooepidemicus]MCD3496881.1 hypothetical protein [Streptococcus equi subsp. equi]HEK9210744.1 hypothetical protein [Streptococcus equi subsp. equi]HEK9243824.1 hypothetical protein [Streptococcus equi subsp. equi]HEK9784175.1 hypothetical protein [Streptococcus equi subsp. equi]